MTTDQSALTAIVADLVAGNGILAVLLATASVCKAKAKAADNPAFTTKASHDQR